MKKVVILLIIIFLIIGFSAIFVNRGDYALTQAPIDVMIYKYMAIGYSPRVIDELIKRGQKDNKIISTLEIACNNSDFKIASQVNYVLFRLHIDPLIRIKALIQMVEKEPNNETVKQVIGFGLNKADSQYLYLFRPLLESENDDIVEFAAKVTKNI
jgi:hypothetical protein